MLITVQPATAPVYVAGLMLDLCQQVWLLIDVIRNAENVVQPFQARCQVHCEVIRQASLLITLHMRC